MKKLMNDASTILAESLAGLGAAHADILTVDPSGKFGLWRRLSENRSGAYF